MLRFEIYRTGTLIGGAWRWRLRETQSNNIIADSAEGYVSRRDCEHGIQLVRSVTALTPLFEVDK